jgi:hypothetical protein
MDHWHLSFPLAPKVIIVNQFCHEMANVDSTGRTGIKDYASHNQMAEVQAGAWAIVAK